MKSIKVIIIATLLLMSVFELSTKFSEATEQTQLKPQSQSQFQASTHIPENHARALRSLNSENNQAYRHITKNLRVRLSTLTDNQGQKYLAALISRAELSPYLAQLQTLLVDDFEQYRAAQSARDHQLFHLTLLSPQEYQFADKNLLAQLLAPSFNSNFSSQLNVTLVGIGKVTQESKRTFFVVAQSADAQLIRQRFLLPAKDFHITLGFKPADIYGVKKDSSTLVDLYSSDFKMLVQDY